MNSGGASADCAEAAADAGRCGCVGFDDVTKTRGWSSHNYSGWLARVGFLPLVLSH